MIKVLSKLYSKLVGRSINPETEILVTCGAYEALYCAVLGHVDEGDEVVIIEPFFDCYEPLVKAAGGIPRFIPLRIVVIFKNFKLNLNTRQILFLEIEC